MSKKQEIEWYSVDHIKPDTQAVCLVADSIGNILSEPVFFAKGKWHNDRGSGPLTNFDVAVWTYLPKLAPRPTRYLIVYTDGYTYKTNLSNADARDTDTLIERIKLMGMTHHASWVALNFAKSSREHANAQDTNFGYTMKIVTEYS